MYNKLFTKILDSTIWLESDATRLVWITFIAAMDEDGFVALSSIGNVAARARVSVKAAEAAIKTLESPDAVDPDQEHEGRRVERVPSGWMVLNSAKYRDIIKRAEAREQTRDRVRKHRLTKAGLTVGESCAYCGDPATGPDHIIPQSQGGVESVPACGRCNQRKASRALADFLNDRFCDFLDHKSIRKNNVLSKYAAWDGGSYQVVTGGNGKVTPSDTDTDTRSTFVKFWNSYPRKVAKQDAMKAWLKLKFGNGDFERVMAALEVAKKSEQWRRDSGKFIPHASTWLNGRRFEDEIAAAPQGERPSRLCSACGEKTFTWTGTKCDACWRQSQGKAA